MSFIKPKAKTPRRVTNMKVRTDAPQNEIYSGFTAISITSSPNHLDKKKKTLLAASEIRHPDREFSPTVMQKSRASMTSNMNSEVMTEQNLIMDEINMAIPKQSGDTSAIDTQVLLSRKQTVESKSPEAVEYTQVPQKSIDLDLTGIQERLGNESRSSQNEGVSQLSHNGQILPKLTSRASRMTSDFATHSPGRMKPINIQTGVNVLKPNFKVANVTKKDAAPTQQSPQTNSPIKSSLLLQAQVQPTERSYLNMTLQQNQRWLPATTRNFNHNSKIGNAFQDMQTELISTDKKRSDLYSTIKTIFSSQNPLNDNHVELWKKGGQSIDPLSQRTTPVPPAFLPLPTRTTLFTETSNDMLRTTNRPRQKPSVPVVHMRNKPGPQTNWISGRHLKQVITGKQTNKMINQRETNRRRLLADLSGKTKVASPQGRVMNQPNKPSSLASWQQRSKLNEMSNFSIIPSMEAVGLSPHRAAQNQQVYAFRNSKIQNQGGQESMNSVIYENGDGKSSQDLLLMEIEGMINNFGISNQMSQNSIMGNKNQDLHLISRKDLEELSREGSDLSPKNFKSPTVRLPNIRNDIRDSNETQRMNNVLSLQLSTVSHQQ